MPAPPSGLEVKKDFYREDSRVAQRPLSEVNYYYSSNEVTVKGTEVPKPIFDFDECGWPERILQGVNQLGYSKPTAIQACGWPIALSVRNS